MRWVLGLILGFGLVATASAEVPQQLHYSGYLENALGEAVDCPDALQCAIAYDLTFRLFDSEDSDTPIWSETKVSVSIYGGSFHALLGTGMPITAELLSGPVWLSVKVNNNVEMLPRQKLTSAAFALRAGSVDYAGNAGQLGGQNPEDFASTESVTELQTIIAGIDDDTLAAMGCEPGQVAKASAEGWICADAAESDTTLSETQVDEMVENNGFAVQTDLEAAQAALSNLQVLVDSIDTSTGVDISGLQTQITSLEALLESAKSNLTTLQNDLSNEVTVRQAADDAEAATRATEDLGLEDALTAETTLRADGDLALQGNIDAVGAQLTALDLSLDPVAKAGLPADLADGDDDTQLTETQVDAYVANNNYAQISETVAALICNSGELQRFDGSDWSCTSDVFVDATGKVGIGITNPTQALEVAGGAKISEVLEVVGGVQLGNPASAPVGTLRWTGTELHINTAVGWQIVVMVLTESAQCASDGGFWELSQEVCYFPGSSCAPGWTPKNSFSTTEVKSCSYQWCCGGWCTATVGPNCTTGAHTRANAGTESCMYCVQSNNGTQAACSAETTEKGCSQL